MTDELRPDDTPTTGPGEVGDLGREPAALAALLRRAAGDGRFVGAVLAQAGVGDDALAARLGCPPENLSRLALCLRPDDGPAFADGVRRIAAHAGCDPARLRDLLREAAAVERLRGPTTRSRRRRGAAARRP